VQRKPRLTVVSPFLDKRHGTETCIAEQLERLAGDYEIHLYSERVEDVALSRIHWHRVPALPGPHLTAYLWWFAANSILRRRHGKRPGVMPELIYSAGINCLDADVISVHIVFAKFHQQVKKKLRLLSNPIASWPVLIHRRLYYRLIRTLERCVYSRPDVCLVTISHKAAEDLNRFYKRKENVRVVYYGCDPKRFCPQRRSELRETARHELGLRENEFAVLLIGNDWKNKGLTCLLEAVSRLANTAIRVLVVGTDDATPFRGLLELHNLAARVQFLPPRADVEYYYAAADLYAGPSLEDAFALPPLEAMACGLPVIASRKAGVSEVIHHGEDGLILENPEDAQTLAEWIGRLTEDLDFRSNLGANAVLTARKYTWESNAAGMKEVIEQVRQSKQDLHDGRS
jgi:glycosyltransferase involved in cell wall biosynthesis